MSDSDTILSAFADGVLSLTLNRPDRLNAFNDCLLYTSPSPRD